MSRGSLERRLQLALGTALLALSGLLLWAGSIALQQLAEDQVRSRLRHDAEALLGALEGQRDQPLQLRSARLSPVYLQPLSGHYFVIRDDSGELLRSRSLWDESFGVPVLPPGESRQLTLDGPGAQRLLIHAAGYRKHDREFTLAVAEDVAGIDAQVAQDRLWFGAGLLVAVVLLLLGQRWLVRVSFRPLDQVRADLARVREGGSEKIDTDLPAEIRPLADEVNALLALLQRRLARSRDALGNLAHALKTPLALVLQTLDDQSALNQPDRRQAARDQAERIRLLVDRELRMARTAGAGGGGRHFNSAADVPDLVRALQGLHRDRDLRFETRVGTDAMPAFDREDLFELLGNLLDNACKWASARVRLTLIGGAGITIEVEDDGPGVSAGDTEVLTRRGLRLDEAREGSGLGLAIASDIAATYGGGLAFDRSPELGGLRVRAHLPAVPDTAIQPTDSAQHDQRG